MLLPLFFMEKINTLLQYDQKMGTPPTVKLISCDINFTVGGGAHFLVVLYQSIDFFSGVPQ